MWRLIRIFQLIKQVARVERERNPGNSRHNISA